MTDYADFSLVLIKDGKEIYSSKESGLKPLIECIKKFKLKNCTLYDKVVGLAAAKIIVYSGMIDSVITPVCSKPAKEFLTKNKIKIESEQIVDNISCPMEKKAMETEGNELFFKEVLNKLF